MASMTNGGFGSRIANRAVVDRLKALEAIVRRRERDL
jgi:hypothetical protein